MGLADQRRGEHLQLAQLPLGGRVDQLHRPRDLDVDLDARLVHQLEAVERRLRLFARRVGALREIFGDLLLQRLDEGALERDRAAAQDTHEVGLVHALAGTADGRRAEQLDRAGDDARHEGRRTREFVVDETLEDRSDRHRVLAW